MFDTGMFGRSSEQILESSEVPMVTGPRNPDEVIGIPKGGVCYNSAGGLFLARETGRGRLSLQLIVGYDPIKNLVCTISGCWYKLLDPSWRFPTELTVR